MCENKYANKIVITMQDMMGQMDISDKTLHRMIEEGSLPDFSYGSKWSKKKGWHTAVLQRHAMDKYEMSNSFKNIGDMSQVGGKDMAIVPLSDSNRRVAKKDGNLNDRNTCKKKLGSKEMSKSMRASSSKSRVATGFTNVVA